MEVGQAFQPPFGAGLPTTAVNIFARMPPNREAVLRGVWPGQETGHNERTASRFPRIEQELHPFGVLGAGASHPRVRCATLGFAVKPLRG